MAGMRTYSKTGAQQRTIEGLFSIMLQEAPRDAETLLVKLQKLSQRRMKTGMENVG